MRRHFDSGEELFNFGTRFGIQQNPIKTIEELFLRERLFELEQYDKRNSSILEEGLYQCARLLLLVRTE